MHHVCCEDRARALLTLSCGTTKDEAREFYARELAEEQTLDNLKAFSERLAGNEAEHFGPCKCQDHDPHNCPAIAVGMKCPRGCEEQD